MIGETIVKGGPRKKKQREVRRKTIQKGLQVPRKKKAVLYRRGQQAAEGGCGRKETGKRS